MTKKYEFFFCAILCVGLMMSGYFLWQSIRPVKIVAIHHGSNGFSDILVNGFPVTDRGKINWWLKNKEILKEKYNIPQSSPDGRFNITFWLFGEGYEEEGKHDRLCFDDMKGPINCIEKNAVFAVNNDREKMIHFTTYDGHFILKENGKVIKYEPDFEVF